MAVTSSSIEGITGLTISPVDAQPLIISASEIVEACIAGYSFPTSRVELAISYVASFLLNTRKTSGSEGIQKEALSGVYSVEYKNDNASSVSSSGDSYWNLADKLLGGLLGSLSSSEELTFASLDVIGTC